MTGQSSVKDRSYGVTDTSFLNPSDMVAECRRVNTLWVLFCFVISNKTDKRITSILDGFQSKWVKLRNEMLKIVPTSQHIGKLVEFYKGVRGLYQLEGWVEDGDCRD